jgi:hypothetical protein
LAQEADPLSDHFAPNEAVSAAFAWVQGAQCTFSDTVGVVLRSDWQKRHWIKISGQQVEFNGDTEMSDEGWYQSFTEDTFDVVLQLQRVLPEPQGSDGVRYTGNIVVTHSGIIAEYAVTGSCGA